MATSGSESNHNNIISNLEGTPVLFDRGGLRTPGRITHIGRGVLHVVPFEHPELIPPSVTPPTRVTTLEQLATDDFIAIEPFGSSQTAEELEACLKLVAPRTPEQPPQEALF